MSSPHELTVIKYLSLTGLSKIAICDAKIKPNELYFTFSSINLNLEDIKIKND